jgi:hypothetical protein
MKHFSLLIYLILINKIGFILMSITHLYLKFKGEEKSDLDIEILYWKSRFEFIFVFLMSFLLIYLFNPMRPNVVIDSETKLLLFLFGFMLLLTAKWNLFFQEAKWFRLFQKSIGTE